MIRAFVLSFYAAAGLGAAVAIRAFVLSFYAAAGLGAAIAIRLGRGDAPTESPRPAPVGGP